MYFTERLNKSLHHNRKNVLSPHAFGAAGSLGPVIRWLGPGLGSGACLAPGHHPSQPGGNGDVAQTRDVGQLSWGLCVDHLLPSLQRLLVLLHLDVSHQLGLPQASWQGRVNIEWLSRFDLNVAVSKEMELAESALLLVLVMHTTQIKYLGKDLLINDYLLCWITKLWDLRYGWERKGCWVVNMLSKN